MILPFRLSSCLQLLLVFWVTSLVSLEALKKYFGLDFFLLTYFSTKHNHFADLSLSRSVPTLKSKIYPCLYQQF